jgi:hypothetical protein
LDPDHDPLEEAVEDLSLVAATSRLRETLSVSRVRGSLEAAVPVLRELIDRTGDLQKAQWEAETPSTPSNHRPRKGWTEVVGLLLLMVATVVTAQGLQFAGFGGSWVQGCSTGIFSVLAFVVLWRSLRGWRGGE